MSQRWAVIVVFALASGVGVYFFNLKYTISIVPRQAKSGSVQASDLPAPVGAPGVCRSENARYAAARLRPVLDGLSAVREGFPGIAAVVVTADAVPLIYAHGATRPEAGVEVTPDTPFYIASQTKSYVGLLAARLDREGVLPLTMTLADVWPELRLPFPADPMQIKIRDLLTHMQPLRNLPLQTRTAYVGELPVPEYPVYLARFSTSRPAGFEYSNLGYLIYAAALEKKTGKDWRAWLDDRVLMPLGLTHTFTRTSRVPARELSWRHQWSGDSFLMMQPKQDSIMHAAGGMYSSANDVARWLQFNLRKSAPGIDAEAFKLAQATGPHLDLSLDKNLFCDGYSLGQLICTYKNVRLTNQIGGYLGARSIASYLPDCGVGVAFMVNSDSLTGRLTQDLTKFFIDLLLQDPSTEANATTLVEDYAKEVASNPENRAQQNAREDHDPIFGDWTWVPSQSELSHYIGRYRSDEYGEMVVQLVDGTLEARIGAYRLDLVPARPNIFGGRQTPFTAAEPVVFAKINGASTPTGVTWNGAAFSAARQ